MAGTQTESHSTLNPIQEGVFAAVIMMVEKKKITKRTAREILASDFGFADADIQYWAEQFNGKL